MPNTPKGPLQGVRVVDLTTVMLGPFCTQILGEMGAEVIKIETPDGDVNRWTGESRSPGMSTGQLIKGRNKRSIVLDLKIVEAREAFEKLVQYFKDSARTDMNSATHAAEMAKSIGAVKAGLYVPSLNKRLFIIRATGRYSV